MNRFDTFRGTATHSAAWHTQSGQYSARSQSQPSGQHADGRFDGCSIAPQTAR